MQLDLDTKQRMDALRNGNQGAVVARYLTHRLEAQTQGLLQCTKESFETQKGRCLELVELINYFQGK